MTIIDHMGFSVTDVERSKAFYGKALAPLGITIISETHGWVGLGRDGKPEFWLGGPGTTPSTVHVAFTA
jgi:catechol 2,3-dioxygenase-like lactoylglutathione lyase family enzyme